ncbi:MAG: type II/IV secretion system protein, partial [Selenomonadaceae bacterium]|nr:type II/IV secretion system protein [Selenomonadaceae bacterium]
RLAKEVRYGYRGGRALGDGVSPIFRLMDGIIDFGISLRASDIHIMPMEKEARLRYRIDGALFMPKIEIPIEILEQMVARIKIMAHIKSVAVGTALDGHIAYKKGEDTIDIRVAIAPVKFGESVVLRIMNAEHRLRRINELGLSKDLEDSVRSVINRSAGMFIACGPMNSGKTTSLYAILQEINSPTRNIMTVEDPVEGVIEGINQIAVNEETNLDFAGGLRAILRMDANVIMVGEIRDEETAKIAVRAALTGHLLLTTLHAENSVSALFRLREMGVPSYLISATLSGILASRLVRKICPHCKEEYKIVDGDEEIFFDKGKISEGDIFYRGRGCEKCYGTGYLGRTPINEFLRPNREIREEILNSAKIDEVRRIAKQAGFKDMYEDAMEKARMGVTTLEEIGRALYVE